MTRICLIAILTLAGCRQIFGLESPTIDPVDAFVSIDAPDAGECTSVSATCVDTETLRTCVAAGTSSVDTTCPWGCSAADARCKSLLPRGSVIAADDLMAVTGLADIKIAGTTTIDTDTGSITGLRTSSSGLSGGIYFDLRTTGGVFIMQSLTVDASVVISVVGARPLVIVALDGSTIGGTIDLRGPCTTNVPGPGGFSGGAASASPVGAGAGEGGGANIGRGGGGGGHGSTGGTAGNGAAGMAPQGGVAFGDATITTLVGGGGGGGGGDAAVGGVGGGGGGAIQIVANGPIVIEQTAVINAGGCGGKVAPGNGSGGGGGAGGTILLEGTSVVIGGILAVNGGGGSAGDDQGNPGTNALASRQAAAGGTGAQGNGGAGGAGTSLGGGAATTAGNNAGGGGGAVGRIRVNTRTGSATTEAGFVMSPAFTDLLSTASQGVANVQ